MIAQYFIQPDDRNHLIILRTEKSKFPIAYVRVSTPQFRELLRGSCEFVEHGAYCEEAKEEYRMIAEFFKSGKIDKVIIEPYVGAEKEFKIEAKPNEIRIEESGITRRIYVRGKVITINPVLGISIS